MLDPKIAKAVVIFRRRTIIVDRNEHAMNKISTILIMTTCVLLCAYIISLIIDHFVQNMMISPAFAFNMSNNAAANAVIIVVSNHGFDHYYDFIPSSATAPITTMEISNTTTATTIGPSTLNSTDAFFKQGIDDGYKDGYIGNDKDYRLHLTKSDVDTAYRTGYNQGYEMGVKNSTPQSNCEHFDTCGSSINKQQLLLSQPASPSPTPPFPQTAVPLNSTALINNNNR
jgi:hypothetical protein